MDRTQGPGASVPAPAPNPSPAPEPTPVRAPEPVVLERGSGISVIWPQDGAR